MPVPLLAKPLVNRVIPPITKKPDMIFVIDEQYKKGYKKGTFLRHIFEPRDLFKPA